MSNNFFLFFEFEFELQIWNMYKDKNENKTKNREKAYTLKIMKKDRLSNRQWYLNCNIIVWKWQIRNAIWINKFQFRKGFFVSFSIVQEFCFSVWSTIQNWHFLVSLMYGEEICDFKCFQYQLNLLFDIWIELCMFVGI